MDRISYQIYGDGSLAGDFEIEAWLALAEKNLNFCHFFSFFLSETLVLMAITISGPMILDADSTSPMTGRIKTGVSV